MLIDGIEYHKRFIDRWATLLVAYEKQHGVNAADARAYALLGYGNLHHQVAIRMWELLLYGGKGSA